MKDCFGLHGHYAYGSVAIRQKIGVGRKSATSGVHTTDPFHLLQAGKTVDISRCASESTDLLPPSALPRLLRSLRLFPPSRPAAGRPAAAAAHRAAGVDDVASGGVDVGIVRDQPQYQRGCLSLPIGATSIYRDLRQYQPSSFYLAYSAIGDFETFDDSRLTAKMGVSGMRRPCQALTTSTRSRWNVCAAATEAGKRTAAASIPASRHRSLAGFIMLLDVGRAATEEQG